MICRQRPYHVEHTGSRPITEVKQRRARSVLGWVTAWEHRVPLAFCCIFFCFNILYCNIIYLILQHVIIDKRHVWTVRTLHHSLFKSYLIIRTLQDFSIDRNSYLQAIYLHKILKPLFFSHTFLCKFNKKYYFLTYFYYVKL